jgi:hypothetical protein
MSMQIRFGGPLSSSCVQRQGYVGTATSPGSGIRRLFDHASSALTVRQAGLLKQDARRYDLHPQSRIAHLSTGLIRGQRL